MKGVLLVAVALLVVWVEGAAVLGIDFGSSNIKVALIRGGTRDVVLNKEGKRKVAALAGLNPKGERVFSAQASNLLKTHPSLVHRYTKHLLGKTPEHPWIKRNEVFYTSPVVADSRGTAAVTFGNATVPAVELVSWLLAEAKEAARHHTKVTVDDCVISVPPYFTHWERADLLQAARMAGLNVLSLVNEGTACAVDYYLTRTISNETGLVLLYDMGDVATRVTLLRFDREPNEGTKKDTVLASVVDVTWDDSLGGRNFDENLAVHLAALATKQTKQDIAKNPRAMERLRAESQRVKEVLSANTDIEARVEGLLHDVSFHAKVSRADFEKLNAPLLTELLVPVKQLLEANGLTVANISEVQVVGGGTRVPKVRETLAAFFGRPNVDAHLNGDDCVCMGAAFYAAMKSNAFKKQPFKFRDVSLFPVSVSHPAVGSEPAGDAKSLFAFQNKLFAKKVLSFTTDQPVSMRLKYEIDAGGHTRRLPAGTPRDLVRVDVQAANLTAFTLANPDAKPKVSIGFRLTSSGTVAVEGVDAEFQAWETPAPSKKPKKTTAKPKATEEPANETKPSETPEPTTEEPEPAAEPVLVNKTVAVSFRETWLGVREYHADELARMENHTRALVEEEHLRASRAETINDLESFVYMTREKMTDDEMERHANETERETLLAKLTAASEWMDSGDMDKANTKVIRARLADLRDQYRVLERRAKMFQELPESFKLCRAFIQSTERALVNVTTLRLVNQSDVDRAYESINGTVKWLNDKEGEFKKQAENVDPIVTPSDISFRCEMVRSQAAKVLRAPRRPPPRNTTDTNSTGGSESGSKPTSEPEEKAREDAENDEDVQ